MRASPAQDKEKRDGVQKKALRFVCVLSADRLLFSCPAQLIALERIFLSHLDSCLHVLSIRVLSGVNDAVGPLDQSAFAWSRLPVLSEGANRGMTEFRQRKWELYGKSVTVMRTVLTGKQSQL